MLTPPVAIAAYAAAPIAGANPLMTAFMSFRLGMAKFIIPFVFAFYPTILIIEEFSLFPFLWRQYSSAIRPMRKLPFIHIAASVT